MALARMQNFSISLDGFGTGAGLSRDAPFGHAGHRLHNWLFATRWWHGLEELAEPGGSDGVDNAFAREFDSGIGAEIMGGGEVRVSGMAARTAHKAAGGQDVRICGGPTVVREPPNTLHPDVPGSSPAAHSHVRPACHEPAALRRCRGADSDAARAPDTTVRVRRTGAGESSGLTIPPPPGSPTIRHAQPAASVLAMASARA